MRNIAAMGIALLLGACASASDAPVSVQPKDAWIVDAQGARIGRALFREAPSGVLIRLEFAADALPPGWHGLHIHQAGTCADGPAGFQASGAHLGHGGNAMHGLLNPRGPEAGDLPNVYAPVHAAFAAEFFSAHLTLAPQNVDDRISLLDADGAALVIHAGPDDQRTQPIGGAGARIGCAALTRAP